MQFLHHRLSNTNTQFINRLELNPGLDNVSNWDEVRVLPEFQDPPAEVLDAVVEELLDHTLEHLNPRTPALVHPYANTNPPTAFMTQMETQIDRNHERPNLPGVMPALPMFYHEDGSINLQAQNELMEHLMEQGIRGFVVMGTTGESALVTFEEHLAVLENARMQTVRLGAECGERISFVAGTGANWTAEQQHLSHQAMRRIGADATLILPPYYVREQSQANLLRHLWVALDEGPGIVYRVSGRTNIDIPDEIIALLMRHPNFLGVKECEGRVGNLTQMFENTHHQVWSGEDPHVVRDRGQGARGSISVTANVHPELVLTANSPEESYARADRAAEYLARTMFMFGNPSTVHAVSEMVRMAKGNDRVRGFRAPARMLTQAQQDWTRERLGMVGIPNLRNVPDALIRNYDAMESWVLGPANRRGLFGFVN